MYTECRLLSVTLSKAFAECFLGFAVCLGHTAKILSPVVIEKAIVLVSLRKENTKVESKRKVKLERTNVKIRKLLKIGRKNYPL